MANLKKRVAENVPGDFFVDSTCIDCDACRQIAPAVFAEAAETSFVKAQPTSPAERRPALRALLACPTGSIGCRGDGDVKAVMKDFPPEVEEPVYYCGFNSPKSYVLLFQDRFLFTGDHLDWDRDEQRLAASEDYCWYSWPKQAESIRRLADYRFEWVLPGHGQKVWLPVDEMREQIVRLADSMR